MKVEDHKKTAIFIMVLLVFTTTCITPSFSLETMSPNSEKSVDRGKPPIVDHFACSDYCPGPEDQYMVKVYEGIEDEEECRKLGGRPSTYVGWGTFHICIAE